MPEITAIDDLDGTPAAEVFGSMPRTVRLRLEAGEELPEHRHPGETVVLHLLSGRLSLSLDGEDYELDPDELIRFDGGRTISPRALSDSVAVLVFCPNSADR